MSLGASFLGGLVSEWNKMTEEDRLAQAEKAKAKAAADAADATRKQELEDEKALKFYEWDLKNREFSANRGRAYSEVQSRQSRYAVEGINAYIWVDNENKVQEKIFDSDKGWSYDDATRLRDAFLKDRLNFQGDKIQGARVVPVTGTKFYNLEYYDIDKVQPTSDPKAATAFMNRAKTDPAFAHLNVGIKQTDDGKWVNTFELKSKTPLRVTREDLKKQLPDEQKAYPDYDVFIVGKPGEATFSYVKKERVTDYASAQASAKKIETDFPYLKALIDGSEAVGFTVRTVEKDTPLFKTREEAKSAADTAANENPDYDFIVIGNNKDGWGYEVRAPKDVDQVVGIDDPNVADQDFSTAVTYSSNYFVFASQGTFDLGEKAIDRGAITIPLTKAADDAIANPSSAMKALKNQKGRAWTVFVPPKKGAEATQPDAYMNEIRKTFSPELVKELNKSRMSGGTPSPDRPVKREAYQQFIRLLNQGVNQYIRGTTQVLGEKTAFDIPENVSIILNEYRGINAHIDGIIQDTFDGTQQEVLAENDMILDQTPEIEVVETGEPVPMPAGEDGVVPQPQPAVATRVTYTKYPNVQSSSLVDPVVDAEGTPTGGYYLKPQTKEVLVKAAVNAGFINPENGEPQIHRVLGLLNNAKEPGGVQGKKSVEAAFDSLVKLQEFFSPEMRTMKSRPAGSGSVRTFTEPMDTAEKEELATYLDVFPDHMSRVNAIRMAIPKTAVASRRARRKSDSPQAVLAAVSGGMNLKRISEEGAVARKALDLSTALESLFEPASGPAAQFGVAADILRMRQAAGYIFQNVIGNLDVNNDFGETREQLQARLRADFAAIPDGDTQQARNALARFLMENLTYVNASMNDPNGRLSEGDRIQSQTALGVAMFFTSPGEIMPVVRLIKEKAEYVSFFGAAVDSGSPELVMSTVIYDQNYKAGRLDDYVSYVTGVAQEKQGDAPSTDTAEADAELLELEGLEGDVGATSGLTNEGVGQRALTLEELALDTNNDGIISDEERQAGEQ